MTRQGVSGVRPATAGPGRQVQDATFFRGLLQSKVKEVATEVDRMRAEAQRLQTDDGLFQQLERKCVVAWPCRATRRLTPRAIVL